MPVNHYSEIVTALEAQIKSGHIINRLPTQRVLAKEFGSSTRTIDKAFNSLKAKGLIYTRPGVGTFVLPKKVG